MVYSYPGQVHRRVLPRHIIAGAVDVALLRAAALWSTSRRDARSNFWTDVKLRRLWRRSCASILNFGTTGAMGSNRCTIYVLASQNSADYLSPSVGANPPFANELVGAPAQRQFDCLSGRIE